MAGGSVISLFPWHWRFHQSLTLFLQPELERGPHAGTRAWTTTTTQWLLPWSKTVFFQRLLAHFVVKTVRIWWLVKFPTILETKETGRHRLLGATWILWTTSVYQCHPWFAHHDRSIYDAFYYGDFCQPLVYSVLDSNNFSACSRRPSGTLQMYIPQCRMTDHIKQ